jgi:FtsH-binding integral membrane protein
MKLLENLVEWLYWLGYVLIPTALAAGVGYVLVLQESIEPVLAYVIGGVGLVLGVVLAEYIRRRYGCSAVWNRYRGDEDIEA